MSAHAGICYFDRRFVPPETLARLDDRLAESGPDGRGCFTAPGLAMVHRALHVTPEDTRDRQPLRSRRGAALVFDGRLDNRDELLARVHRDLPALGGRASIGDAALALAIIERDDEDAGLRRLIGEWSLALWRAERQTLTLASDYSGTLPLYYVHDERRVAWSTDLAEIVERERAGTDYEPRVVIGYLTRAMPPELTPYRRILAVPPAHALTWHADGRSTRTRFYTFAATPEQRPGRRVFVSQERHDGPRRAPTPLADPRDAADALRHAFRDAVRVRLRARNPVWAELSGGIDSSSIVCMADDLRRAGDRACTAPAVDTVSAVSEDSPETDERRYIAIVEQARGRTGHHLSLEDCAALVDDRRARLQPGAGRGIRLAIMRAARQHGVRVVMTGNPGDLVMGNWRAFSLGAFDHLGRGGGTRHGETQERTRAAFGPGAGRGFDVGLGFARDRATALARCVADLRRWSLATKTPIWHLIGDACEYLLPAETFARRRVRDHVARLQPPADRTHPRVADLTEAARRALLLRAPAARIFLEELTTHHRDVAGCWPPSKRRLYEGLTSFLGTRAFQTTVEEPTVRLTHPYLHRPLVELVWSLPAHLLCQPGRPRALMRDAFAPFVPAPILNRTSKGYAMPFILRTLREQTRGLASRVASLQVVERDYVDPDLLREQLEALADGTIRTASSLFTIMQVEWWLAARARDSTGDTAAPRGGVRTHAVSV